MRRIFNEFLVASLCWGIAISVVLSAYAYTGLIFGIPVRTHEPASPYGVMISDDDPGWDCATMGNRICGVNPVTWWGAGDRFGLVVLDSLNG